MVPFLPPYSGIKPGWPAQQESTQSIMPLPLDRLIASYDLTIEIFINAVTILHKEIFAIIPNFALIGVALKLHINTLSMLRLF